MISSDIGGLRIYRNKYELMGKEKTIKLQGFLTYHTLDINFWIRFN